MASKKNRSRKSLAVALAIVGVAGLSMASAAQLTVTSDEIVAGVDTFAACDDAVTVSYTRAYHAKDTVIPIVYATSDYYVSDVVVSNLNGGACNLKSMTVQVLGTGDASILTFAPAAIVTADTGKTFSVTPGTLKVGQVYGVAVEIG